MNRSGGPLSKSNIKDYYMNKHTRKTAFGKWIAPINAKTFGAG